MVGCFFVRVSGFVIVQAPYMAFLRLWSVAKFGMANAGYFQNSKETPGGCTP